MEIKLDRKFLSALGIDGDKADQICTANSQTVNRIKAERDELQEKLDAVTSDLQKVTRERDELKASAPDANGVNPYKTKYDALKKEYDAFKADTEKAAEDRTKSEALRTLLQEIGVSDKRIGTVLRVSSVDDITLNDKGEIENADDLKTKLKTEWADFITAEEKHGANPANPPANTGGGKTVDEIMAIQDDAERQAAIAQNHELFGF